MELQRFGVKFFAAGADGFSVRAAVPVFHSWIQQQAIPGHLLIDVHDYSHIFQGPGILLVGHEGNFSLDQGGGRLGLLYHRKTSESHSFESSLTETFKTALLACRLLEQESGLEPRLRFLTDEALLVFNDRLNVPNDAETRKRLAPAVSQALQRVWATGLQLEQADSNPRERLALRIRAPHSETVTSLLARL